jgi:hypothetical protein
MSGYLERGFDDAAIAETAPQADCLEFSRHASVS